MSGIPAFNIPAFDGAKEALQRVGWEVVSPADLDEHPDIRQASLDSPDGVVEAAAHGKSWEYFIARDSKVLFEGQFDAIVTLPGWEASRGARLEVAIAEANGIRRVDLADALKDRQAWEAWMPPVLPDDHRAFTEDEVLGINPLYDADGKWIKHEDNPLRQRSATGGVKDNRGKPSLELIPAEPVFGVGRVLGFGARKYKPNNWRLGLSWLQTLGSALRHIFAFIGGEDIDPESGECHVDNAITQLMFVSTYYHTKTGDDDRWSSTPESRREESKA